MKRIICAAMILIMLVSLSGCSMSQEGNAVNRMILSIGKVTKDSESKIAAAEAAYEALTDEQKDGVFLYGLLQKDRAYLEYLAAAEEYNTVIAGYNAAAQSYSGLIPGLSAEYDSFYGYAAKAEEVNAQGPAYDETLRDQLKAVLEAGKAFFSSRPETIESVESYSVVSKTFKRIAGIRDKISEISEKTEELRQKTEVIMTAVNNISEGQNIIDVLSESIDALSDSVTIKEHIEVLTARLNAHDMILTAEPGIFETGHEGTIYFTLNPEHSAATGLEYSGAVEIYSSPVEAGISAEKLSAMSELMGPAYAEDSYLIRFAAGMPASSAQRIAAIIAAIMEG